MLLVPMLLMINIVRKSARLSCYFSVKFSSNIFPQFIRFRSRSRPVFDSSGSGSDQNVSAPATPAQAQAPAPAPHP